MMMIIGETKLKSFAFKGGEVGVDGEVAPPPAAKEPGFSFYFLRFFWIKFSWILTCGKGIRFVFSFFPTCLSVLDVWVEIVCRLFLFEAVCVFRAEAPHGRKKKGLLNFYIRAQAKLTRPPED